MQGGMGRRRTANCSKGSIPTNYGPDILTSHWPELSYVVYKAIKQVRNSDLCWRWPKHWDFHFCRHRIKLYQRLFSSAMRTGVISFS